MEGAGRVQRQVGGGGGVVSISAARCCVECKKVSIVFVWMKRDTRKIRLGRHPNQRHVLKINVTNIYLITDARKESASLRLMFMLVTCFDN